jgi:hypothetical protein
MTSVTIACAVTNFFETYRHEIAISRRDGMHPNMKYFFLSGQLITSFIYISVMFYYFNTPPCPLRRVRQKRRQ